MQFQIGNIGAFFRGDPTIKRWYTFDNTLIDFTRNYNGSGSISGYRPSNFRHQLSAGFDNDDSKYIYIGTPSSELNFVPKSILFWFKCVGQKTSGRYQVLRKGDDGIHLYINSGNNNKLQYTTYYDSSSHSYNVTSLNPVNDSRWHFACCINTGSQTQMWIDGVLQGTDVGGAEYHANNKYPTVGRDSLTGKNSAFHGSIGEFAIFSRALSPQEISQYYKWATGVAKKNYAFESIELPQPNFFPFF